MDSITKITEKIRTFRDDRDWMQFHNPKEIAAAIAIESAELQEIFLWKDYPESETAAREKQQAVADEINTQFTALETTVNSSMPNTDTSSYLTGMANSAAMAGKGQGVYYGDDLNLVIYF